MWKSITDAISNVTTVAVSLIGLSVALEVVFGGQVPFLSLGVINNISGIVSDLGSQGLIGLITLGILWALWKK
jgi:ABC-type enterochelin transport system permease subunit